MVKVTDILYITFFSTHLKFGMSSIRKQAFLAGDVVLGSLTSMHLANGSQGCGDFDESNFYFSLALIFAVEEINRNPQILQNLTLGYYIRDNCHNPAIAMKDTYEMLQSSPSLNMPVIIGAMDSGTAVLVGGLLQAIDMPAISPSTTSQELGEPMYQSFFRTISSDQHQAKAMADVIEKFKWQYIAGIALDNSYGRNGLRSLQRESLQRGSFCLAFKEFLPFGREEPKFILTIVRKLKQMKNINVIVLWSNGNGAMAFLEETARQKVFGKTWILSEAIAKDYNKLVTKYGEVLSSAIGIHSQRYNISKFQTYFRHLVSLREYSTANPWLREFMELHRSQTRNISVDSEWICSNVQIYVPHMIDGVYAVALALDNMYKCQEPGLLTGRKCPQVKPRIIPKDLSTYLRNVSFYGITGKIQFDRFGDPLPISYEVFSYQRYMENNTHKVSFKQVGKWSHRRFTLNRKLVKWPTPGTVPLSVCMDKCKPGTLQTTTIACCWQCIKCPVNTVSRVYGSSNCSECPNDQKSNKNRTQCIDLTVPNTTWTEGPAILCVSLAVIRVALCILVIFVFIKHKNTPLVKSSGFELSIVFLMLIAAHFALASVYFAPPSHVLCKIKEPWRYVSLTGCISILLLKTLRLASAFELVTIADWFKKYLQTATKQIFTIIAINATGIILCLIWLLTDPPYSHQEIIAWKSVFVTCIPCKTIIGKVLQGLIIAYLFILCWICTFYATKARQLPGNFNETRLIGFSMYSLLLSWITFYSVDFSLESRYVSVVDSSTILMSSYAMLCFMFGPKLNIILRYPEKNTRECVQSGVTNYAFNTCRRTELSLDVVSNAYTLEKTEGSDIKNQC